jgi:uncharacterized membrane protein YphA (DoxX/SURF4 family)
MSRKTIAYLVSTSLLSLVFVAHGLLELTHAPGEIHTLERLGYPAYVADILGVGKLLGVLAILAPRFARLKEWAYAGIVFDLKGAIISHIFAGDAAGAFAPALLLGLAAASWALRPESRRLPSPRLDKAHDTSSAALLLSEAVNVRA